MMDDWDINAFEAAEIGDLETLDKLDNSAISQMTDIQHKSLLHYAAKSGQNQVIVKLAGDCGCDVNAVDGDGSTPLHEAAKIGRDDTIHQLLEFGPDTSIVAGIFGTPLHQAAQSGKYAAVQVLLEADSSLEAVTVDNATVLHFAALGGNEEVIKDIVKRQPDLLDREDDGGLTPLHYAAREDSLDAVCCLHDLGAKPLICAADSGTPLHCAVGSGQYLVAELLLNKGCPVDVNDNEGATSLHWAAAKGSIEMVKQLAKEWQCNVNAQKKNGCTALHLAAMVGHEGVIQLLIELGADSTIVAADSGTPLHCATLAGHYESSMVLLNGYPPNLVNNLGRTALHSAALKGHTLLIALLISNGFDVNAEANDGCTPMHVAAANGHTDAVVELIEHRAILCKVAGACGTPLHQAALAGHAETVQEMLKRGCRPDVMSTGGSSALHFAAQNGEIEVMQLLVDSGCDVNATNADKYTPLHFAAANGKSDAVRALVGPLQADKALVAGQSGAPLHRAAFKGHYDCAFNLLEGGHPADLVDSAGCTPLHKAAEAGEAALFTLLSEGHNVNAVNPEGVTPLHFAAISGSAETVQTAIECHANLDAVAGKHGTPLHQAVLKGHEDCARTLMQNDCRLNVVANDGAGVLHFSARGGCIPLLWELVIEKQCDVHAVDEDGFTPLHMAAACGQPEAVSALVDLGSDLKADAKQFGTPVHVAALFGRLQVLEGLTQMGISLTGKTGNGSTVLHSAASGGQSEVVHYLVKQGCDVNAKNDDGNTPLDLAQKNGKQEAAQALIDAGASKGCKETKILQSNSSDDSDEGSPGTFRKLGETFLEVFGAAIEVGDAVIDLAVEKVKARKEKALANAVNANNQEQILVGECKAVQSEYDALNLDDPILSQPVYSNDRFLIIIRDYVSRKAAGKDRAMLEGLRLPPEVIDECYVNNPRDVEAAVHAGILKWSELGGCTWRVLLKAMVHAKIGYQHCMGLRDYVLYGQEID